MFLFVLASASCNDFFSCLCLCSVYFKHICNSRFLYKHRVVFSHAVLTRVCENLCTLFVFKGWDGLINISVCSVLWKQCSNSLWACVWEKRGKRYLSEMWGKGIELNLSGSTVHLSSVKCAQGSIKHTSRFCLLLPPEKH